MIHLKLCFSSKRFLFYSVNGTYKYLDKIPIVFFLFSVYFIVMLGIVEFCTYITLPVTMVTVFKYLSNGSAA